MTPITYNKLVRDRVPEIIRADGWIPHTGSCDADYLPRVRAKLLEEVAEYFAGPPESRLGELVDIQEVLFTLALHEQALDPNTFLDRVAAKKQERGGFTMGTVLLGIEAGPNG